MRGAALLLPFLLFLVACGARPTPAPQPPAPFILEAPTPTVRPAGAALWVLGHFRDEQARPMRALLERFARARGISIQYEGVVSVSERLREQLEAGEPPDVILLPVPGWLQELAAAGAIPPLPEESARAVQAHFGPAWIDLVSHEGTLYGVPFDANAKSLLWYRRDTLGGAVEAAPTDLEELLALAASLDERGQVPFAVAGGAGWPLTDWFESVLLASAGPQRYDDLLAHRIPWTDAAVEKAAQEFVTLLQAPWVLGGAEGAATLPLTPESFARAFDPAAPDAAFWLGSGALITGLAGDNEPYDLFPFPANGGVVGVGSVAIATNSREESQALLTFLAQPEAVEPWVRQGGFISPNHDLPLSAYPTSHARQEAELLINTRFFRYDLSDRLPPNLKETFLPEQLRQMLRHPEQLPTILAEIERVATREQGSAGK